MDTINPYYLNEKANYIKTELTKAAPLFKWTVESLRHSYPQTSTAFVITGSVIIGDVPFYVRTELPLEILERADGWLEHLTHELAYAMAIELLRWKRPIT